MRAWIAIPGGPPKYTAQQRRWSVVNGRPRTYPDKRAKHTREELAALLEPYKPDALYTGPLKMQVDLYYPYRKSDLRSPEAKAGIPIPKVTRPDVDNSMKLLQDVMTGMYYVDDSQIYSLNARKFYGPQPGLMIDIKEECCDGN